MPNTKRTDSTTGLSSFEAKKYLAEFGENTIYHRKRLQPIIMFLKKFNNPLLYLLIAETSKYFFYHLFTKAP